MKLGLFGGTFNPIHNGHIKVICHVKKQFGLNQIHLIPSAVPPHKTGVNLASAKDRLEMVKCSIKDVPGLIASDIELKRCGPSFTIDTIKEFKNMSRNSFNIHSSIQSRIKAKVKSIDNMIDKPIDKSIDKSANNSLDPSMSLFQPHLKKTMNNKSQNHLKFYLIMGTDAFFDITTWKKNIEIFKKVPVIVMMRAGETRNLNDIACFVKDVISMDYIYNIRTGAFINQGMNEIYISEVPEVELSSTLIRKRVQDHLPISSMVSPCVEKIIIKKGLYL